MNEISAVSMVFTAIFALGCLFLILAPIFGWSSYFTVKTNDSQAPGEKEVLLTTLNELEFEYKMDKLSKSDYLALKKQYETKVAAVMKNEAFTEKTAVDEDLLAEVEKEIQQAMLKNKKDRGES